MRVRLPEWPCLILSLTGCGQEVISATPDVESLGTSDEETFPGASSVMPSSSASHSSSSGEPASIVRGKTEVGSRCDRERRVGGLSLTTGADRTILSGAVGSAVLPSAVPIVSAEAEGCQLLVPANLFCSSCASNETCAGEDQCVAKPVKVSAGALVVDGLLASLEATPNPITFDYSKTLLEPFPAYEVGAALELRAEGGDVPAFAASLTGVAPLTSSAEVVAVGREKPALLVWDAEGADAARSAIYISFSVNVHGAVTGWIECTVDDDGQFEIPAPLVTALIDRGLSGFPRVDVERRSSATVELGEPGEGCLDVYVGSKMTLEIDVEGLTSCNSDEDCEEGQSCTPELVCER